MRHRKKRKSLSRKKAPRELMLRNLATSIILYEKVQTTEAKAKAVRPIVEGLITKGKENSLHNLRYLLSRTSVENAAKKVIEDLGPRYKTRPGGYTRIIKLDRRQGDGAAMAQIELV